MIIEYKNKKSDKPYFLADNATIIGDVRFGEFVTIWFGAVIRADINYISIGDWTNIQDNSVLHITEQLPVIVGKEVTAGHNVILHGCTIGNRCLIGMGAIVLDGAHIGEGSIIGAGAVIKENERIPERSLVVGVPGKVKRSVTDEEYDMIKASALHYKEYAKGYGKNK
mgnify:CR=1 FL=1